MKKQKHFGRFGIAVLSSAFLSSCVNDIKVSKGNLEEVPGDSNLEFRYYDSNISNWETLLDGTTSDFTLYGCKTGSEYTFRILNHGPGKLTSLANPVITKTTASTSPTGSTSAQTSFTIVTPPTFPVAAGAYTDFTVKLLIENNPYGDNYCLLGAKKPADYDVWSYDQITIALTTNDPSNPNFEASLLFLGGS